MCVRVAVSGLVLLTALPVPAQTTRSIAVEALVCDATGRLLAGAEFGDHWQRHGTEWRATLRCSRPGEQAPLRSDAEGRLSGTWIEDPFETPLLGLSADRRHAVFVTPTEEANTHAGIVRGKIVMPAAVVLRGAVRTSLGAAANAAIGLHLRFDDPGTPGRRRPATLGCDGSTFALPLPPGTYQVGVAWSRSRAPARTAVLAAGQEELDLGPISVPLVPFDLKGEVLPDWEVSEAANITLEAASLANYRGKPLLVCFDEWGGPLRTGAGVREGLAALVSHPRRAAFHVVLFDTSFLRQTRNKREEPAVETMFPLLRAAEGKTADRLYGSNFAVIVLDREGRLVHCGADVGSATAALERLLAGANVPPK